MSSSFVKFVPAIVLLAIALFFFSPYLNYQQFPYAGDYTGSDLTELNIPLRFIATQQIQNGRIPLWSDLLSNGFPLLAEGQAGVFYPLNVLHYWLFPFLPGIVVGMILHYFLAALFTYYLCREYGMSTAASLFSAIAFGFSSPFLFRIKHLNLLDAAVWLPLALLWTERLCTRLRGLSPAVWLAAVLAVQLYAGHPQVSFITIVVCVIYAAVRMLQLSDDTRVSWGRFGARWMIAGFLAVGLSAVQLLPSFELSRISGRGAMNDIAFATIFSYNPKHLLTFLNPYIFGNPAENTYALPTTEGGFWESSTYMGILPLALACIGFLICTRKDRIVRTWLIVIGVCFLFIISTHNPLFPYLWRYVPGMDLFRFHHRFLIPVVLGASVVAGRGWDWVREHIARTPRLQAALTRSPLMRVALPALFITATVIDLFLVSSRYIGAMPASYLSSAPLASSSLTPQPDGGRIYSVAWDRSWAAVYRGVGGWRTDAGIYGYHREVLPPNIGAMFGISSVDDRAWQEGGQTVKWLSDFWASYLSTVTRDEKVHAFVFPSVFTKLWGMQNARYFLSFSTLQGPDLKLLKEVAIPMMPAVRVYENARVLPRAWFVGTQISAATDQEALSLMAQPAFDPRHAAVFVGPEAAPVSGDTPSAENVPVEVESWDNGRIAFKIDAPKAGVVVLSQTYYPGWEARVDGLPARVERANVAFQAVAVSAGRHRVVMEYVSQSFRTGMVITLVTLVTLVLIVMVRAWRRRRIPYFQLFSAVDDAEVEGKQGDSETGVTAPYPLVLLTVGYLCVIGGFSVSKGLFSSPWQLLLLGIGLIVLTIPFFFNVAFLHRMSVPLHRLLLWIAGASILFSALFDGGMYLVYPAGVALIRTLAWLCVVLFLSYLLNHFPQHISVVNPRRFTSLASAAYMRIKSVLQRVLSIISHTRFAWLCVFAFVMRLLVIGYVPVPAIDVFFVMNEGASALLDGQNPYTATYSNPFNIAEPDFLTHAYTYLPGMIFASIPWRLFFGDVRIGYLIAQGVFAFFLYRMVRRASGCTRLNAELMTLSFLFIPHSLFVVEQSWNDIFILLGLGGIAWLWSLRAWGWSYVLLGVLLSLKHTVFGFLPFLSIPALRVRKKWIMITGAVAAIIVIPFALWDWSAFVEDTIMVYVRYTPTRYALSFNTISLLWQGSTIPSWLSGGFLIGIGVGIIRRVWKREPAWIFYGASIWVAWVFVTLLAHPNYYYLISGTMLIVITLFVACPRREDSLDTQGVIISSPPPI